MFEEVTMDDASFKRRFTRVWIEGAPNSGKTTSFATWPKPIAIVTMPGEKGTASAPTGEGIKLFAWKDEPVEREKRDIAYYAGIYKAVDKLTVDLLAGKHGTFRTVAFDGVHKFYDPILAMVTDGQSMQAGLRDEKTGKLIDFDPVLYTKAHRLIWEWVSMVANSSIEYVVFTSWSENEKDDPNDKSKNATTHIMPDLPGKAARRVIGEVSVVLHAHINDKNEYVWQTKPGGKVWGAGVKGPAEIVKAVPAIVPQDWSKLEPYLLGKGGK